VVLSKFRKLAAFSCQEKGLYKLDCSTLPVPLCFMKAGSRLVVVGLAW
jgi:hypothetical protein